MTELVAYLTVFVAAAIPWLEVLLVVPAGIVAGLAPGPTVAIGAAGNLATLIPLVVAGDRIRSWWQRRSAARADAAVGWAAPGAAAAHQPTGPSAIRSPNGAGANAGDDTTGRSDMAGGGDTDRGDTAGGGDTDRGDAEVKTATGSPRPGASRDARARGLFERFGLPGLALLGPLLTGVHVAGLVALGAGARRRPTLVWLSAGVVVWAIAAALGTIAGLEAFVDADALPDWFA